MEGNNFNEDLQALMGSLINIFGNFKATDTLYHVICNAVRALDSSALRERILARQVALTVNFASNDLGCLLVVIVSELTTMAEASGTDLSALSVSQQKALTIALDVCILSALLSNFEPGVGVPWEKRVTALSSVVGSSFASVAPQPNALPVATDCIFHCWQSPLMKGLVESKFLNDILAALLQVCYGNAAPQLSTSDRNQFLAQFDQLMINVHAPLVIRELLVLQTPVPGFAPPPKWLKLQCGRLLSCCLVRPQGLRHTLRVMFELSGEAHGTPDIWKRCEAIAMIITSCPKQFASNRDTYYKNICRQLADVLSEHDADSNHLAVVACAIAKVYTINESILKQFLLSDVFKAFESLFLANWKLPVNHITLPSEGDLTHALDVLHRLVSFSRAEPRICGIVSMYTPLVFQIYCQLYGTTSHCAKLSTEALDNIFFGESTESAVLLWKRIVIGQSLNCMGSVHPEIAFKPGADGGVRAVLSQATGVEHSLSEYDFDQRVGGLVRFLKEHRVKYRDHISALLLSCLGDFSRLGSQTVPTDMNSIGNSSDFQAVEAMVASIEEGLAVLSLLSALLSEFQDIFQDEPVKALNLCTVLLRNLLHREGSFASNEEIATLILGLVSALTLKPLQGEDGLDAALEGIFLALRDVSLQYSNADVRQLAGELCSSVENVLPCPSTGTKRPRHAEPVPKQVKGVAAQPTFEDVLRDIGDPLPAVRGHGLIALADLVRRRDKEAMGNEAQALQAVLDVLEDEDSYVYLSAINALSALGERRTSDVFPVLLGQLNSSPERSVECRLKISEALTKISKAMGDLGPYHGEKVIGFFMSQCKDTHEDIRAGALSNIAELGRLMSYRLIGCLNELFSCLYHILRFDKSTIVRRGASHVLHLILQNAADDLLQVFGDTLRDMYRLLKELYTSDNDEVVRLHAQLSLEVLNENMKTALRRNPLIEEIT